MAEPLGIIYPPPDLRTLVDTAARFVARNGREFESRMRQNEPNNPKYNFLNAGDPYHAYYEHKIRESLEPISESTVNGQEQSTQDETDRAGGDSILEEQQNDETTISPNNNNIINSDSGLSIDSADSQKSTSNNILNGEQKAQSEQQDDSKEISTVVIKPVIKKLRDLFTTPVVPREPPPEFEFIADPPSSMTVLDLDIIKLTAQFVAMHGRNFLTELLNREQNNTQFDFLRPQHGQFNYFTLLIEQYSKILNHNDDMVELLTKDATNQKHVMDKVRMRSEWSKLQEAERKRREEEDEQDRLQYAQIDWHDFVVVETVDYQPNDRGPYPPPTTADQVGSRVLLQQRLEEQNVPEEMEIDMDVESDEEASNGAQEDLIPPALAEFLPPKPETVLIKKDYDPKQKEIITPKAAGFFTSPITHEPILTDKLQAHLKYNLIDSRYIEQKDRIMQEKANQADVFASGSQIESSLKHLAERRTDIFGYDNAETAIGRKIGEEEDQPKADAVIWDGHRGKKKK